MYALWQLIFRMSLRYVKFILLLVLSNLTFVELSTLCSDFKSTSMTWKDQLATKTGYFNVKKDQSNWKSFFEKTSQCTQENVWLLTRHGTRYPIEEDYRSLSVLPKLVIEIEKNFMAGRGCLQQDDVDKYSGWIPPYEQRDKGELHSEGADELFSIGEHWRDLFRNIFSLPYNPKQIKVQFTVSNRTGESAYHFLRGMYGEDAVGLIDLPKPKNPDLKLRFQKFCPAWLKNVYKNKNTYIERRLFEKTRHFESTLHAISARLGFISPISRSDILAMYDECRYETAWYPHTVSIWCKPFTQQDITVVEFFQDLKYYYEDAYGIDMNPGMACETMTDLLAKLRTGISTNASKKISSLYFSHDKVLLHFFSSLGLFKPDKHLTHSDFENSSARVFRTSHITPFASNIGFGLFKCDDGYKVATFFQGTPIYMKHICSELLCDWASFENYLNQYISTCNFSKTCDIHDEL